MASGTPLTPDGRTGPAPTSHDEAEASLTRQELADIVREEYERLNTASGPPIGTGPGSPEGVVAGPRGLVWVRSDGAAGDPVLYVKESDEVAGDDTMGWVPK